MRNGGELERLVAPWPLLLGALLSFLGCCAAGAWYSRHNVYENFQRFHQLITPESLHYPTASQVLALARSALPPEKVAVVVGGNSVLNGCGQRAERLWTRALQAALGDDYRVLNLAVRGALPAEFGGAVAEALGRERRLIFVTLAGYGVGGYPDGLYYSYFYWGAWSKGLLLPHRPREEYLRELEVERPGGAATDPLLGLRPGPEKLAELRWQARLNRCCYFNDLWNALAYQRLSTVWSPFARDHVFRPRKRFADADLGPGLPFENRYAPYFTQAALRKMRAWLEDYPGRLAYGRSGEVDPEGSAMVRQLRACFPPECRPRTLLLVPFENPYYLAMLTPAEQALCRRLVLDQVRAAEGAGLAALAVGQGYTVDDCYDGGGHYSERGGLRLAAEVAPKIQDMARRLGYLREGGRP